MLQFSERRAARIAESEPLRSEISEALRAWLRLDRDAVIRAAEVGCSDVGRPDIETIVLLMLPGRSSQAVKVIRSMRDLDPPNLDPPNLDDLAAQPAAKCSLSLDAVR